MLQVAGMNFISFPFLLSPYAALRSK